MQDSLIPDQSFAIADNELVTILQTTKIDPSGPNLGVQDSEVGFFLVFHFRLYLQLLFILG